jgi:hypothetical protein
MLSHPWLAVHEERAVYEAARFHQRREGPCGAAYAKFDLSSLSGFGLAHFCGTGAEFWLNLQSLYELRLAQKKAGKTIQLPTLQRRGLLHA